MKNNYIPIVFASDDHYAMPTSVAITSIILNKEPKTIYKIYIVVSNLSSFHKERIKTLECETAKIEFIYAAELLEYKMATLPNVTSTDYYRLMLDTLLDEDKIIALDGDLIILEDLSELYNIELEDNYIAGCYFRPHDVYNRSYVQERLGLEEGKRINIGVMVMNLRKIRENNLQPKFLSKIGFFDVMSEDIINFVCKDKIKIIPVKYNFNLHFYKYHNLLKNDPIYSPGEYKKAEKNPVIFHYTLAKPWKKITKKHHLGLSYLKKSPYKDYNLSLLKIIIGLFRGIGRPFFQGR